MPIDNEFATLHNGEPLGPTETALVWSKEGGWSLRMPEAMADTQITDPEILGLGAMIIALRKDPESILPLAAAMEDLAIDILGPTETRQ